MLERKPKPKAQPSALSIMKTFCRVEAVIVWIALGFRSLGSRGEKIGVGK